MINRLVFIKVKNLVLILFFSIFLMGYAYAQNDWIAVVEEAGVVISKKQVSYNDVINGINAEYYELKFENTTDKVLNLGWKFEYYINGVCSNCDSETGENIRSLQLQSLETYTSDCTIEDDQEYVVFVKLLDLESTELTDFTFTNLIISE